jgi:hypothetical protein
MVLEPGGIIAWLLVGLIAGWLTGKVMRGGGYGAFRDIILGVVGAVPKTLRRSLPAFCGLPQAGVRARVPHLSPNVRRFGPR